MFAPHGRGRAPVGWRGAPNEKIDCRECDTTTPSILDRVHHVVPGGLYTEVDPPTRLAFTWIWDGDTRRTLIEIDFEERDGVTTVAFTHRDLWDEEAFRSHEDGWTRMFDILADYAENRDPRP